jgi:hypothetical protein
MSDRSQPQAGVSMFGGVANCARTVRIDWRPNDRSNQRFGRYFEPPIRAVVNTMG